MVGLVSDGAWETGCRVRWGWCVGDWMSSENGLWPRCSDAPAKSQSQAWDGRVRLACPEGRVRPRPSRRLHVCLGRKRRRRDCAAPAGAVLPNMFSSSARMGAGLCRPSGTRALAALQGKRWNLRWLLCCLLRCCRRAAGAGGHSFCSGSGVTGWVTRVLEGRARCMAYGGRKGSGHSGQATARTARRSAPHTHPPQHYTTRSASVI